MLVVVSPAKKLNMNQINPMQASEPLFKDKANELAKFVRDLSTSGLKNLMGLSDSLANLNAERFINFGNQESKPAAFAFAGDTYQGLDATTLDDDELRWAQAHLRILSGLYGILRPLDKIEPYRLEMGSKLKTKNANNLYEYWGKEISNSLNKDGQITKSSMLINCASKEYFSAINRGTLKLEVITPVFMEETAKGPKVVSFFAKRARGAMARFIITRRLTELNSLKEFDMGGYKYNPEASDRENPIFVRPQKDK